MNLSKNRQPTKRRASKSRSNMFICGATLLMQLLAILSFATSALPQELQWAKRAGGTAEFDLVLGIALDGSGNSYVTGRLIGTATFGPGEANETNLTAAGVTDIFIAKYNTDGTLAWAKQAGGTDDDQGIGIAVDGSGNIYLTGQFRGTVTFGPGESNETNLTSAGSDDIFVAKYNNDGTLAWAKQAAGSASQDSVAGITVDGSGNSYVTGPFHNTVTFGPGEDNETNLTSAGSDDIFVAKYNSDGTLAWAKRAGGTDTESGNGIAVDGSGNSYLTGRFRGTATFGAGDASQTNLISVGSDDIFVAKYNSDGTLAWVKKAGGTTGDQASAIGVDSSGNSYVTGFFRGTATFGLGEGNETNLTAAGTIDMFVAKYNSDGTLAWAKGGGDNGRGIALDGSGNSYVTGVFESTATFGSGEANETVLNSAGSIDLVVAKYNSDGTLAWAKRAGGTTGDQGNAIAVDDLGNSYVTGLFEGTATFGAGEANETNLTSAGGNDIFVAKFVVDSTPPGLSVTGPIGTIQVNNATFSWTGTDNVTPTASLVYAYRLDPIEASFSAFGSATTKSYPNLPDGDYTFFVKVKDEVENESQISMSFTVNTIGPEITLTPTFLAFGSVAVGDSSANQIVAVRNDGKANLSIGVISLTTNQFSKTSDKCSKKTLAPNASCTFAARFKPTSTGTTTAALIIPSNDPNENPVEFLLTGTGGTGTGGAPEVTVTPLTLDFGNVVVGNKSADQIVTVKNDGTANLSIGAITLGGTNANQFATASDKCSKKTLAPNATCTVAARFKPTSSGAKAANLVIPSNDADENPVNVSLSGTGTP